VLKILVDLHFSLPEADYLSIVQCLVFLDDQARVAEILNTLIRGDDVRCLFSSYQNNIFFLMLCKLFRSFLTVLQDKLLLAYQIAFDLCEISTQQFRRNVREVCTAPFLLSPFFFYFSFLLSFTVIHVRVSGPARGEGRNGEAGRRRG
jgi:hypothetical protein